jgi:hypothetical protein
VKLDAALLALDEAIAALPVDGRAAAAGALAAKASAILAGLAVPQTDKWLTVDEASDVAGVPVRRIRTWARRAGITWATRPTRRTLRIHEGRFREWLTGAVPIALNGSYRSLRTAETAVVTPMRTRSSGRVG